MRLLKKDYKTFTDEQLVIAMAGGDQPAFNNLYDRYSRPLMTYFMRMLWKDRELAEDFLHDLFAKLVHRPELFDTTRSFKTWVYSVANNMCKNEYKRREVRRNTSNGLDSSAPVSDVNKNTMNQAHERLFREAFDEQLQVLDQKHREVFEMRHFDGLALKEIADVLQISEGTVKSRLFYATKYLAEGLKEYNPVLTE